MHPHLEQPFLKFWISFAWTAIGLCLAGLGRAQTPPAASLPMLTNIIQIRHLTRAEADAGQRVRVRACVTFYDHEWQLFLEDETGGCYVFPTDREGKQRKFDLKSGDFVEIEGVSIPGEFTPCIDKAEFTVLERKPWPAPRPSTLADLSTGQADSEWVEVEGIVHTARLADGVLALELVSGRNRMSVYVMTPETNAVSWIDAKVRVRGVCGVKLNARKQLLSAHLQVPGPEHLRIVEAPPSEPSLVASQPISSLMVYTPQGASGHRVRIHGVVTFPASPKTVYVKDTTGGLCLRLRSDLRVRSGDLIEADGFPLMGDYTPCLEDGSARILGHGSEPTPLELTTAQLQEGQHDAEFIRVKARIIETRRKDQDQLLVLQSDDLVFAAAVMGDKSKEVAKVLETGSVVELTGICQIQENEQEERSIQILVASPKDVSVLRKAPWWSSGRLAWTLGLISGVLLIAFAWGVILATANRRLNVAKVEFCDLYDNAPVGYQEFDQTGRITRVNKKELLMLGYASADDVRGRFVWDLVVGSHLRTLLLDALAGKTCASAFEESFHRKDGSLLPVWLEYQLIRDGDGQIRGARSTLQDISELKNAQAALEQARSEMEERVTERTAELACTNTYLQEEIATRQQAQADSEELHKQLLETSRLAGKAEVATSVLHNVGNVLNSVNVSSTLVSNIFRRSKSGSLAKVVALLQKHQADLGQFLTKDPKGMLVLGYLQHLGEHLAGEQADGIKELSELQKNIDHIKEIVAMQQSFAKVSGVEESLNVTELVEDALRMNAGAISRQEIQVSREFMAAPRITVEKHKVLQILINLVRNAKQACAETNQRESQVTLRVTQAQGRVQITVADNGVGISAENISRIFAHGFTTKKNGHGFGLHSGALAAKELGGSLKVTSEGLGQGAIFTLELPLDGERIDYAG